MPSRRSLPPLEATRAPALEPLPAKTSLAATPAFETGSSRRELSAPLPMRALRLASNVVRRVMPSRRCDSSVRLEPLTDMSTSQLPRLSDANTTSSVLRPPCPWSDDSAASKAAVAACPNVQHPRDERKNKKQSRSSRSSSDVRNRPSTPCPPLGRAEGDNTSVYPVSRSSSPPNGAACPEDSTTVPHGTPFLASSCAYMDHRPPDLGWSVKRPVLADDGDLGEEWPASEAAVEKQFSAVLASLAFPEKDESALNPEVSNGAAVADLGLPSPASSAGIAKYDADERKALVEAATKPRADNVEESPSESCARRGRHCSAVNTETAPPPPTLAMIKDAAKRKFEDEFMVLRGLDKSPVTAAIEVLQQYTTRAKGPNSVATSCSAEYLGGPLSFCTLNSDMASPLQALEC